MYKDDLIKENNAMLKLLLENQAMIVAYLEKIGENFGSPYTITGAPNVAKRVIELQEKYKLAVEQAYENDFGRITVDAAPSLINTVRPEKPSDD